jgi:(1->4)-alpha-D-glucan 1-alpha-D-glucosylmutase
MWNELRATYRVQLNAGFGFDAAASIVDYLASLGITHLYCSPYFQSAPGSTHGYDVVDHSQVNGELGGAEAHARLCGTLARHGLGQVLDIVPNHMAINVPENRWWWDVLENGPSSLYAAYFDVDWDPPEQRLLNTVLLPVLGDQYGRVLEAGELKVSRDGASFRVCYHQNSFPVSPRSLDSILEEAAGRCRSDTLAFLADAFSELPLPTATDVASVRKRHRDKEVLRSQLDRLCREEPAVASAIDGVVSEINRDPEALHALLERQNYRLVFWRAASRDLGYRRFFDVNALAGLRAENEEVFLETHDLVLRWLADETLNGVRVDHPDGLRDPEQYLWRLHKASPRAWIIVEKILEPGERLPESWPVAGTTGYDFLNKVGGLFIDPDGEKPLTDFYAEFTGARTDFAALVRQKKHLVLRELLGSDVNRLSGLLIEICERHRRYRDYTRDDLREALEEVAASFPVYRTYVRAEAGAISQTDARYIAEAIEAAKATRPDIDPRLLDFLHDLLMLRIRGPRESEWAMRFQQLTGPAMAKGLEDTVFYCFNRLVSLNEVGGAPSQFGVTTAHFHGACAETQQRWPLTMVTTSTHDTKRSEDVRARIALLSEIPTQWIEVVRQWSARNDRHRHNGWPDKNMEYLLYQTMVGAWPIEESRLARYAEKASREAKEHTSWNKPHAEYDEALQGFVSGLCRDEEFQAALELFVRPLVRAGRINSLAQTLIKLTAPGIPDLYQGSELWDLSLVDPDNRRPVNFAIRRKLLAEVEQLSVTEIWARLEEGLPKLWVTKQALGVRKKFPMLFGTESSYRPLNVAGAKAAHVVAFERGERVATIVPRLLIGLGNDWGDTTVELSAGHWQNCLTGEHLEGGWIPLAEALKEFPVALLHKEA